MKTTRFFVPLSPDSVEEELSNVEGAFIVECGLFVEGKEQYYDGSWVTPINTEDMYTEGAIQYLCNKYPETIHFVVREPAVTRVVDYPHSVPDVSKYETLGIPQ